MLYYTTKKENDSIEFCHAFPILGNSISLISHIHHFISSAMRNGRQNTIFRAEWGNLIKRISLDRRFLSNFFTANFLRFECKVLYWTGEKKTRRKQFKMKREKIPTNLNWNCFFIRYSHAVDRRQDKRSRKTLIVAQNNRSQQDWYLARNRS